MTPENFCYWLQGFAEITSTPQPSEAQWQAIKDHLQLVFTKETPKMYTPTQISTSQPFKLGEGPLTVRC